MHHRLPQFESTLKPRSGATLTEVLMSLLIFSVGVVSVFTLFPVALLSSIQATKLTNSKILSDNVVELVRSKPDILRPPGAAASNEWEGAWKRNWTYQVGDLVWPPVDSGVLFPTPNLAYRCTSSTGSNRSAQFEPRWARSGTVSDGDVEWAPVTSNSNYVVDPLGRFIDGTARPTFGYNGATPVTGGLARTQGGDFTTYADALPTFSLPDTWTIALEAIPASVTATSVTFPSTVDLSSIAATNHRVVVTSPDGLLSATRTIDNISGKTINLDAPPNLPGALDTAAEVGNVRVEVFNPRYSYFLTVRRPGPFEKPTVTAVVIFNRSFSFDDEEVYDANFGNSSYTNMSRTEVEDGGLGTDQVKVAWDGEAQPPLLREGNYVFDARNALWYQMTNIQRNNSMELAIITLDRTVEAQTVSSGPNSGLGRAIFMPGIVKIFEL